MSFCDYTTQKDLRIRSRLLGSLKWGIFAAVLLYMCVILLTEKRYQKKDSVISSVHTKVKGVADADSRIWDTAEYTIPSPGGSSFFVLTNIIKTENQKEGNCSEFPSPKTICSQADSCKKGYADPQSNGIQTGRCIQYNSTVKTCEVRAWCPVESKSTPEPAILGSAENFTVLIKNNIHFAAFNYTTKNILPEYNVTCVYNKVTAPQCPIFRLGDILKEAGHHFSQVAILGGIMGIEINWNCNLDRWLHRCRPQYSFRRLDDKVVDERLYPGLNFRFARYYKMQDQSDLRTLIKAYGIRFDIQVYGTGGQFSWLELVMFIGSYLSYFGLATVVIDFIISLYCKRCCSTTSGQRYFDKEKYEEIPGPCILTSCQELKFVSFVDQEDIIMVDKKIKKSLQVTKGKKVKRGKKTDNIVLAQLELSAIDGLEELPLYPRSAKKSSAIPSWCRCLKCLPENAFEDQLCCRYQNGECITNSEMFRKLVLQRLALVHILQYNNPLINRHSIGKKQLAECARNQYVQWRFGSNKNMMDFAKIPSCCKHEIENTFNGDASETSLQHADKDTKMQSASDTSRKPLLKQQPMATLP
ncbi:PREDICTED: P2X purinoceptor 7 [Nanorana parkeri]|uniref:P2X purinoceptor 7 n=1 Tax=Nanorana parkeri TaxID=125878 RepID=UPI000854724C|nr:PREDICTED: P2X purinoceptor 7 [Nanorana parkeri]